MLKGALLSSSLRKVMTVIWLDLLSSCDSPGSFLTIHVVETGNKRWQSYCCVSLLKSDFIRTYLCCHLNVRLCVVLKGTHEGKLRRHAQTLNIKRHIQQVLFQWGALAEYLWLNSILHCFSTVNYISSSCSVLSAAFTSFGFLMFYCFTPWNKLDLICIFLK